MEFNRPELLLDSLRSREHKMASGVDSGGDGVILFGVPCKYPMPGWNTSLATVAGLTTKYMGEVLFLDSDNSLSYSSVIRKDGSYVVGNEDDVHENYFDGLYSASDDRSGEASSMLCLI